MSIRVWGNRGVEDVPVSEITEHPDNANIGHVESIKESIRVNGFRDGVDRASFAATESTGKWDY